MNYPVIIIVEPQKDKEYLGTVKKMCLNADYAAVMFDNRIQLHLVSSNRLIIVTAAKCHSGELHEVSVNKCCTTYNPYVFKDLNDLIFHRSRVMAWMDLMEERLDYFLTRKLMEI